MRRCWLGVFGLIFGSWMTGIGPVMAAELCRQPVETICSSPSSQQVRKVKDQVDEEFRRLTIRSKIQSFFGYCYDFARETGYYREGCRFQVLKVFEQKFFPDDVKSAAQREFEIARTQVLEFAGPRFAKTLQAARLSFDLTEVVNRSHRVTLESFSPWNAFTDVPTKVVYIGAIALLAKSNPLYLRWVFSHELGHLLGPTASLALYGPDKEVTGFKPWSSPDLSFRAEIDCLRQDAGGTTLPPARDTKCMLSFLESYENGETKVQEVLKMKKHVLLTNPLVSLPSFDTRGRQCQMDHTEEIFADWVALNATVRKVSGEAEFTEMLAGFCIDLDQNFSPSANDLRLSHPGSDQRIWMLVNDPAVQRAIGCETGRPWACGSEK